MKKLLYNISLVGILMMLLSSCDLDLQTETMITTKRWMIHISI